MGSSLSEYYLTFKGLCIVPIIKRVPFTGKVKDAVRYIGYMEDITKFCMSNSLDLYFLTYSRGLVTLEDELEREVSIKDDTNLLIWASIVSEQTYRVCVDTHSLDVYLLNKEISNYRQYVDFMKQRGILVHQPILGMRRSFIPSALGSIHIS